MIHYIKGKITMRFEGGVVIENGGIGYEVFVPGHPSLFGGESGEEVTLYTAMIVREDDMSLFGFANREDIMLFKQLMTVNGVGAKAAMSILSAMSADEVQKAIIFEDAKSLTRAQGIGGKTAQRIILELKDKVADVGEAGYSGVMQTFDGEPKDVKLEAVYALMALGYGKTEAAQAVSKVDKEAGDAQTYIKLALKNLT